ncbi:MAG: gfo/Idh/MocA family oxidoreductase [Bacteroidetes bacterium]|nr:gfo/Idh/MocA family oxidoreductase [Bacteroidota bacterium]
MTKTKFAIMGFGHIGRRHATIVNEHPSCELMAIIETDKKALEHELYPKGVPSFASIDEMISAGVTPEVINIATPNGTHVPLALEALKSKFHVVIEKPMGISRLQCEQVLFESLNVNKQVFIVKQNRYSPPSKWLKEIVSQNILGDIYMVQVNCYWNRDDRYYKPGGWKGTKDLDGGVLYTQFSHFIDIMFWIFGDIKNIKTNLNNFNHQDNTEFEDSGNSIFEFVNGGFGSLNFSTSVWDTNMESSITVVGSKGSVKIGGQYLNEIEYCHVENYDKPTLPPTNPPNDYGPFKGSAANHHYVIQNVVDTLNGNDSITANALEGLKVVDIIERIYDSAN